MKISYLVLTGVLLAVQAHAQEPANAPLGLKWGETAADLVQKYSAQKTGRDDKSKTTIYLLKNTPVIINDFDTVYGITHEKHGLVRVTLIANIDRDASGTRGDALYKKYKKILSDKYGKPESFEYMFKDTYKSKDSFYQCLAYEGCGARGSFYKNIVLRLVGEGRGKGTLELMYDSEMTDKIIDEQNEENDSKAREAL